MHFVDQTRLKVLPPPPHRWQIVWVVRFVSRPGQFVSRKNWCEYAARASNPPTHRRSTIGAEGEECDEKIQVEQSGRAEGARSSNRNTKNRCSFIEKITLDDVRASWLAGYPGGRTAVCSGVTPAIGFCRRDIRRSPQETTSSTTALPLLNALIRQR
jgi:hypothetical protein